MRLRKGGQSQCKLAIKKRTPAEKGGVANREPHPVQRVIEFVKSSSADDVVGDRIIFEVGGDCFAIKWTARSSDCRRPGQLQLNGSSG